MSNQQHEIIRHKRVLIHSNIANISKIQIIGKIPIIRRITHPTVRRKSCVRTKNWTRSREPTQGTRLNPRRTSLYLNTCPRTFLSCRSDFCVPGAGGTHAYTHTHTHTHTHAHTDARTRAIASVAENSWRSKHRWSPMEPDQGRKNSHETFSQRQQHGTSMNIRTARRPDDDWETLSRPRQTHAIRPNRLNATDRTDHALTSATHYHRGLCADINLFVVAGRHERRQWPSRSASSAGYFPETGRTYNHVRLFAQSLRYCWYFELYTFLGNFGLANFLEKYCTLVLPRFKAPFVLTILSLRFHRKIFLHRVASGKIRILSFSRKL